MEKTSFDNGKIHIDRAFARFEDSSYPIMNIGAVMIVRDEMALSGLIGFLLLVGLPCLISQKTRSIGLIMVTLAIGLGFLMARAAKFMLVLRTSSGDQRVYKSRDRMTVEAIKTAIETAIAAKS